MSQAFPGKKSDLVWIVPLVILFVMIVMGAAMLVAGAVRFLLPVSYPITTAVVALILALWFGRALWEMTGSIEDDD